MLTTYPTNDPRIIFVCIVVAIICGWAIGKLLGMGTATRREPPPFSPKNPAPPEICGWCHAAKRERAKFCYACGRDHLTRPPAASALPPKTGGVVCYGDGTIDFGGFTNFVNSRTWVSPPGQWTTLTTKTKTKTTTRHAP